MPFDNPHETPFGDVELLMDARGRISDPNKWTKGRFRDGDRHCLVAALSLAAGSRNYTRPNRTERRLAGHLAEQFPPGRSILMRITFITARQRLIWFNDGSRTKHEDVMALFDRTVDHLAGKVPHYVSA
jgi:hypothetical protein